MAASVFDPAALKLKSLLEPPLPVRVRGAAMALAQGEVLDFVGQAVA